MKPHKGLQTFSELEILWYKKLEDSGFEDIEDTSDPARPLTVWHSHRFLTAEAQIQKKRWDAYQERMDAFASSPEYTEIINLMVKHGNSMFSSEEVSHIWEMHKDGNTERKIAREMTCSQSCIHFLLKRMKEWMKLI